MGISHSPDLMRRFNCYGLPLPMAQLLAGEIRKWEDNSGPKWTVDRLKSLKQDLIRIHIGEAPQTWVKTNRSGGWYGVWGFLRHLAETSRKGLSIALNCVMAYSAFIPDGITDEHFAKACESIASPKVSYPQDVNDTIAAHAESVLGLLKCRMPDPLLLYQGKDGTKSPRIAGASVQQNQELFAELEWIKFSQNNLAFINRHFSVYRPVLAGLSNELLSNYTDVVGIRTTTEVSGGKLCPLTKDGGLKVRWIANPFRIHQRALTPLGDTLFKVLGTLPWDCTFDQAKPYSSVQEHLKRGGTAYSVDLSSATDYFPLELQLSVLRRVLPHDMDQISLFEDLSRLNWTYGKRSVCWTNGQPMGLYPSFPSFALAHGLLLDYLAQGVPGRFFVLGDDVVILHTPTYQKYVKMLEVLGCPYNPSKSLVSNQVAEFAGKLIFPERIVSAFKWRDINSNNFMDLMRTFGQRFKPMLRKRELAVYTKLARLLEPYGCNHSDGIGIPLEHVAFITAEFESKIPETSGRSVHTSFFHLLAELHKPNQNPDSLLFGIDSEWLQDHATAFDEKVGAVFEDTPFANFPGNRGVLVDVVDETRKGILPTAGDKPKVDQTESLLECLERLLGNLKPPVRPHGRPGWFRQPKWWRDYVRKKT